jgi:hypothetical protein
MKTEELLRYDAEFKAMQEALGVMLLVFKFSSQAYSQEKTKNSHGVLRGFSLENCKRSPLNQILSKGDELRTDR